jgi:hypothetical protein
MTRFSRNNKCVVFYSLLIVFGVMPAFGGTKAEVPKGAYEEAEHQVKQFDRLMKAAEDKQAYEEYEKRNATIKPCDQEALPPNPDNAALLYYQACLFAPEPNESLRFQIRPNGEPTTQIRTYLGHCLPVIEILETASRIPGCTWGIWPKGGISRMPWTQKIGLVTNILLLDATTLAIDGHYHVALDRCLTVRRIGRHLSYNPELFSFGISLDEQALHTIQILLGMMPPDVDTLTWFRGQFAVVPGPQLSYAKMLLRMVNVQLDAMKTDPDRLNAFKNMAVTKAKGELTKEHIRNLTNEQFLSRARDGLARFTDSIFQILDNEGNGNQKLAQMNGFVEKKMEDDTTDPIVKGIISGINIKGQIDLGYTRQIVEHKARVNGTKAAVEVYLILAKTGKLPEKLPDYLPKDPFTGKDFIYEITDEGFALCCQGEEFLRRKNQFLEFKVQK